MTVVTRPNEPYMTYYDALDIERMIDDYMDTRRGAVAEEEVYETSNGLEVKIGLAGDNHYRLEIGGYDTLLVYFERVEVRVYSDHIAFEGSATVEGYDYLTSFITMRLDNGYERGEKK